MASLGAAAYAADTSLATAFTSSEQKAFRSAGILLVMSKFGPASHS